MVSLRFPFSFSQPPKLPKSPSSSRPFSATTTSACVAATSVAAITSAVVISKKTKNPDQPQNPFLQTALNFILSNFPASNRSFPIWGSLSLADSSAPVIESRSGVEFPSVVDDSKRLLGVGLRRKAVFGLKNINVYAFGVYADDDDVKKYLNEKYGKLPTSEFKDNKKLNEDIIEGDISMTVRLQIVYGRLSIGSVRSAFEDSVGSRLQKFGGSENKELLQRFTSQFKDEYKIPKGSVINLSRERGYVLRTTIDGTEVGSIQSRLLCRSVLDLYIGEEPFDKQAKEDIELKLGSLLPN